MRTTKTKRYMMRLLVSLALVVTGLLVGVSCTTSSDSGNTFDSDILPLFTQSGAFYDNSAACSSCHSGVETGYHEMDLNSYDGVVTGADTVEAPPGASLLGQAAPCDLLATTAAACLTADPPDWEEAELNHRLRNTRMPPGWAFDITEGNRDTSEILAIAGFVRDGAPESETDGGGPYAATDKIGWDTTLSKIGLADSTDVTTSGDTIEVGEAVLNGATAISDWNLADTTTVGELFSTAGAFYASSLACNSCHSGVDTGYHEMDLGSYSGLLTGADTVEAPPGASLLGQSAPCADVSTPTARANCLTTYPPDWEEAELNARLRNTRMPPTPGWAFTIDESNRDTDEILLIQAWVEAGAPETDSF